MNRHWYSNPNKNTSRNCSGGQRRTLARDCGASVASSGAGSNRQWLLEHVALVKIAHLYWHRAHRAAASRELLSYK